MLAPVTDQRNNAILIVTIAALLAIGVSIGIGVADHPADPPTDRRRAQAAADGDLNARAMPEGSNELVTLGRVVQRHAGHLSAAGAGDDIALGCR